MPSILVVNSGSSSLKVGLYEVAGADLRPLGRRNFDAVGDSAEAHARAFDAADEWRRSLGGGELVAIGHRVVHGGSRFFEPVLIDDSVLAELDALAPLAPLHQPACVAPIRALRARHRGLPQVACFDTAFHHGRPDVAQRYGLPDALFQEGVRRYGFHGLSYEFVAAALVRLAPEVAGGRVVVAHLGAGASLCAMRDGRSVDTTMGFSALDGLVMATRCGDLDPGVLLHLLRDGTRTVAEVERLLYHESGLRGLSGLSSDTRELLASGDARAAAALEAYVLAITRHLGAMVAVLGGLDALVFTAGVGENSAEIRARVGEAARWAGIEIDADANARGGPCITAKASPVSAWVIATDEEATIARHTARLLPDAGA